MPIARKTDRATTPRTRPVQQTSAQAAAPVRKIGSGTIMEERGKLLLSQPRQERARAALARIIECALTIVAKRGVAALGTEEVARRAGVNISTLYKYFRNKESIVRYLALDLAARQTAMLIERVDMYPNDAGWREVTLSLIDVMIMSWTDIRGFRQLQTTYLLDPGLHHSYMQSSREVARAVERFRRPWGFKGTDADWERIFVVFGECATALLDLAVASEPKEQARVVEEMRRLNNAYYGLYFRP